MGRMPWVVYLWPGLPQIARDGRWSALLVAAGFAALVNLALSASLLWSELFAPGIRISIWAVVVVWAAAAVISCQLGGRSAIPRRSHPEHDAFPQALDHYLKGNWFESERVLLGLLEENPRDLDAGLMLATLLRRTGRPGEAERQLDRLERFDGCEKWELEIRRERELLNVSQGEDSHEPVATAETAEADLPVQVADAA